MIGRLLERGGGWGETLVLALAFALSAPIVASAVAPPVPTPEAPGPGPLFNPDDIHTNPIHMAMGVMGSPTIPACGPLATAANLAAGVMTGAWDLDGIMTNRYNRRSFGAAMLFSSGFNPGASPLSQIGMLPIGQSFDFWALQDTDKFLHILPGELNVIEDGRRVPDGGPESEVYNRILKRSFFTSPKAFSGALRKDLTYTHLLDDPVRNRGAVVRVEGRLLRINRFRPPHEVEQEGVSNLYEAWIFNEVFGASPFCVVTTHWPDDLPRSYLGRPKLAEIVRVRVDGYFVKTFRYRASDGRGADHRGTERETPLVVAHSLVYEKPTAAPAEPGGWVRTLFYAIVGTFGALCMGVLGVTFWYRRNDNSTRRRLMARNLEFVLPTPDAIPQIAPLATPVHPSNATERSVPMRPRITFPSTGKGDRGERSSPKEGQPPDEGAGA